MAITNNIKCVGVFSSVSPFGHWGEKNCTAFFRTPIACQECDSSQCKYGFPSRCISEITVKDVESKLKMLLSEFRSSTIAPADANIFLTSMQHHQIKEDTSFLVNAIENQDYRKLLDVGFGSGNLLMNLSRNENKILWGIEKSTELFSNLKKMTEKIHLLNEDLLDVHLDEKFDAIVFSFVLHHLQMPWKALEKYITFLEKNGYLYIVDRIAVTQEDKLQFPYFWENSYCRAHEWVEDRPNIATIKEYQDFFERNNFSAVFTTFPHDNRNGTSGFPKTLITARKL